MNLRLLKNNIAHSIRTTNGLYNAIKKLFWLYNGAGRFGGTDIHTSQIEFKYPDPIGKVSLKVRYNQGSDAFIMSEVFDAECYRFMLTGDIKNILDLGANAGFTAVYFSKLFPNSKIACVEPMPNNVAILKENLALNKVISVVFDAAVATDDGQITMETGDMDYGNKVSDIPFGKTLGQNKLIVDGLTVNTIIKKLNWKNIDLVKIDIEGYEGVLLCKNNDWLSKTDTILIEIHEGVTIDLVRKATDPYGFVNAKYQQGIWIVSKKEIT